MLFDIFYTDKYDDKIAVITGDCAYTFSDIKKQIAYQMEVLKNKSNNVVILTDNNFNFIIHFFASIFGGKNIYLLTDKTGLKTLDFDYVIADNFSGERLENYEFPRVNPELIMVNFYTSGSSGRAKNIKKTLQNLMCETMDLKNEINFPSKNYRVMSTTSMCHLFGLTFHLMLPLYCTYAIDTESVISFDDIDKKDVILISTPTFLNSIERYSTLFKMSPEYIFSAGSKLNEKLFKFLEEKSKIIEIYGSTETGIIARKTHYNDPFVLFNNVEVKANDDYTEVASKYIYNGETVINDRINVINRTLRIECRTDRLLKVYEKRVCADELEDNLRDNVFINDCYITTSREKPVCLCVLSDTGKEYLLKNGIPSICAKLKKDLHEFSPIVPQRWKFIDLIPMTSTGKVNRKLIEHIFNVNLSFPVILDRNIQGNSIDYRIFFYNQCNFFKGHFPQFKLLPGVAQLYLAKEFANIHFNLTLGAGQWKKIKFTNIIEPDSIIHLKLEKTDKSVCYEYYSESKKYASGMFLCDNVFKELR